MGFDHDTYTYDPPFEPEKMCVPPDSVQDQAFVVTEIEGVRELVIVWSYPELIELEHCSILEFGGIGMPNHHPQRPIRLGGDYPQLFLNIRAFQHGDVRHWVWQPGLHVCLAPSRDGETYGIIGWKQPNGQYRALLYPDRASARGILAQLMAEDPALYGPGVELHRPYLDRSVLPEQSSLTVIEFGPTTAWWFTWWYTAYRYKTEEIR